MDHDRFRSASFDDVAYAALSGTVVVAVCADLVECEALADWLDSAVPACASEPVGVIRLALVEARSAVERPSGSQRRTVVVVEDATSGPDAEVVGRWAHWNVSREALLEKLSRARSSVVLLATARRMPDVATVAPELLSVAHVLTVDERAFSVDAADCAMVQEFRKVRSELEQRYGISSTTLVDRLFQREPPAIPAEDLTRWQAVVEALRETES